MIKKYSIIFAFVSIFTLGINAQENDTVMAKGEIVMTESELARFLERIALIKKKKMQEARQRSDQEELRKLRLSYYGSTTPDTRYSRYGNSADLVDEINRLNARISYLTASPRGNRGNTSTYFLPQNGAGGGGYYYPYNQPQPLHPSTTITDRLSNGLQSKIDSLQQHLNALSTRKDVSSKSDEIAAIGHQIEELQTQLLTSRNDLTVEEKAALKRYGNTRLQIFFANNAANVASQYRKEMQRAANIAKENPQLAIVLKGFASTAGNPRYNYELSMRRNESVKRMLIDYGVFPDQITSIFYGEDTTTSESVARRVDISFILK